MKSIKLIETEKSMRNIFKITVTSHSFEWDNELSEETVIRPSVLTSEEVDQVFNDLKTLKNSYGNSEDLESFESKYLIIPSDEDGYQRDTALKEISVEWIDENSKLWLVEF